MKILQKRATNQILSISHRGLCEMLSAEMPEAPQMQSIGKNELREHFSLYINQRKPLSIDDGIAFVHVKGALLDDASPIELAMGSTSYEEIAEDIKTANENEGLTAIVMVVDSPGGTVSGIKEAVAAMDASTLPIYGYNAGQADSAAYYIISNTKAIAATPSAESGNIGTVLAWYDDTKFLESMGVEYNVMTNEGADLKGTFRDSPMTEEQQAFLQDSLNRAGEEFNNHVKANRESVSDDVSRAGWYDNSEAIELGLIDFEATLPEFVEAIKSQLDIDQDEQANGDHTQTQDMSLFTNKDAKAKIDELEASNIELSESNESMTQEINALKESSIEKDNNQAVANTTITEQSEKIEAMESEIEGLKSDLEESKAETEKAEKSAQQKAAELIAAAGHVPVKLESSDSKEEIAAAEQAVKDAKTPKEKYTATKALLKLKNQ